MTVSNTIRKAGPYTGNGVTISFPFSFKVFTTADVLVTRTDLSAVESTLAEGVDYTVALNADQDNNPGGTVNMVVTPAIGYLLTLTSQVAASQSTSIPNPSAFYPKVIEAALDRAVILIQQLNEQMSRALKWPVSSASATLPIPVASALLGWNAAANAIINYAGAASVAVSSAMQGIVSSSTTQAALALFNYLPTFANAVVRTLMSRLQERMSAKDFGAIGDGATSDMTALTNAVAAAAGRKLFIPAGTYKLPFTTTDALTPPANCVIEGDGPGLTILRFEPSSTTLRNFFNLSAGGFTLRNLSVSCVEPATGQIVMFAISANGMVFENCDFDGCVTNTGPTISHTAHCFGLSAAGTQTDISVRDCTIHRVSYGTLKTNASTAVNKRIAFLDCDFYGNYYGDLSFNSPNGSMDDVQVANCRFRAGAGAGASVVQIYCAFASITEFSVTGCTFEDVASKAIHMEEACYGGTITGNTINTDGIGINITDNNVGGSAKMPQYITVQDNTIRKSGTLGLAGTYGIYLVYDGSAEVPIKNAIISGNSITGFEHGISTATTLDDGCQVIGNVIENCTRGLSCAYGSLAFIGNTTRGCTTGVYSDVYAAFDQHTFINCTTNADAVTRPFILTDPVFMFPEFAVGAASTTYKNLLPLGANDRAHGFLNVSVMSNVVADRGPRQDEVTWDGTTFTRTNKITEVSGAMAVDTVKNAGILAVQVFATNALSSVIVQAKFNGMVVVAV